MERERKREPPSEGFLPKWPYQSGLGQPKPGARNFMSYFSCTAGTQVHKPPSVILEGFWMRNGTVDLNGCIAKSILSSSGSNK